MCKAIVHYMIAYMNIRG